MGFTDPFIGTERKTLSDAELAQAIRIDMAAELDAINLYQAHLESTDNQLAKQIIQHIMDEEKDHLEEFAQLLYLLDPRQAESAVHAKLEVEELGAQPALIVEAPGATAVPEPKAAESAAPAMATLTVGSLKT